MARKDSDHQKKSMSLLFRGKAIFKPLNTGRIDEHVACVPGDDLQRFVSSADFLLQLFQRTDRQLVVLGQRGDKAVASVRPEPDRVAGEKVLVVNEIDHVAPGVAGDEQALDLDISDLKDLAVAQQDLFVLHPDHWQFI